MGWTKRQFIEQAFSKIGLAGYVFDLTAEQLQSAARDLDAMMGTWDANGIRIGWPLSLDPGAVNIDTDTGAPTRANEAIYLNLATRIGSDFGKEPPARVLVSAKSAYDELVRWSTMPREMQFPGTLPAGAGNKTWRDYDNPFVRQPDDSPIQVGDNGQLDFIGD